MIDKEKLLNHLKVKKKVLRESLNFAKQEGETTWAEQIREQMEIYTDIIILIDLGNFDKEVTPCNTTTSFTDL